MIFTTLNNINLFHGNCTDIVMEIDDKSVDMVLTDIPYLISKKNNIETMPDRKGRNGIDFGDWDYSFSVSDINVFVDKITDNGCIVVFHSFEQYHELRQELEPRMVFKDKFIWEKTNPMPRNRDRRYISNIEMASWYVKPKSKWVFNRQNSNYDGGVYRFPSESGGGFKRYHPCQKNEKLLEQIIYRHTNKCDTVLDPYMGGGSTGVACIKTGRKFIGIEIDDGYFNNAKSRIEELL